MSRIEPHMPYRDLELGSRDFGYPQLCNLPNGNLLASTWMGRCLEISPDTGRVSVQPQIGLAAVPNLASPACSTQRPILCSAATHVVWTAVWRLGESETTRVSTDGPVNAVALSANGDVLAAGLGMYPLDPAKHPQAGVQLFSTADPFEAAAYRILPGVAVDRVVFDPSGEVLLAVTGARTQDRGHVFLLGSRSLEVLDLAEVDFPFCHSAIFNAHANRLILSSRNTVEIRSLNRLWNVEWAWRGPDELFSAAYDAERGLIFLSDGRCLEPESGEVERLPPLSDCTAVAVLGDGHVAGISQKGVLRLWELDSE